MTGGMLTGTILVVLTWAALAVLLAGAGLPLALATASTGRVLSLLRSGLWWGLGVTTVTVLAIGLWLPLGSPAAGLTTAVGLLVLGIGGGVMLLLRGRRRHRNMWRQLSWSTWLLMVAIGLMITYLAYKSLGPATNYDTGLYHYGFIRYFSDFGTVPGLANLFLPFGYANAQFPLAAILTATPWELEGWRLLNGLLVVLVSADVILRLLQRRRTWGAFVLIIGMAGISLPLVAMADSLISSPTADTAALLLTLVSAAYLCDLLEASTRKNGRRTGEASLDLGVVVLTTGMTIAMRPTMLAYAFGVGLVIVILLWRSPHVRHLSLSAWVLPGIWLLVLGGIQIYRDYLLSGWLLYPLSVHRWDVAWAGPDPTALRDATLAAARDPSAADGYAVAHSWEWVGAWIARLPQQWEPWFILAGLLVLVAVVLWARRSARFPRRPRLLVLSLVPGVIASIAWFLASPPSFRFAWGPLFILLFIMLGAAVLDLHRAGRAHGLVVTGAACIIIAVTAFSLGFRHLAPDYDATGTFKIGPWAVTYSYAELPEVPTRSAAMVTGLVVQMPVSGDRCWATYPLCTFSMGDRIGLLGDSIGEGFVTVR